MKKQINCENCRYYLPPVPVPVEAYGGPFDIFWPRCRRMPQTVKVEGKDYFCGEFKRNKK